MVIYEIENLINGKKYIGKDSKNNPNYLGSGKYLKLAIKKYGRSSFKKTIIEVCSTVEELNSREVYWLQLLNCKNSLKYYNATDTVTPCRAGRPLTEEHRKKLSEANRGKKHLPKTREAIERQIQSKKANGTNRHTEETKLRMSKASLGKPKSAEHKASMSACRLGIKTQPCSEEKKKKISEKQKKKAVLRLDKHTQEVLQRYESILSVRQHGYNSNAVQNVLKGTAKLSSGFIWKYE